MAEGSAELFRGDLGDSFSSSKLLTAVIAILTHNEIDFNDIVVVNEVEHPLIFNGQPHGFRLKIEVVLKHPDKSSDVPLQQLDHDVDVPGHPRKRIKISRDGSCDHIGHPSLLQAPSYFLQDLQFLTRRHLDPHSISLNRPNVQKVQAVQIVEVVQDIRNDLTV